MGWPWMGLGIGAVIAFVALAMPDREIATEIVIDAPPPAVWAILADGAAYPQWNPFIRRMDGTLAAGATLTIDLQASNGPRMTIRPVILKAAPPHELRWRGRLWLPGLLDGVHSFQLDPIGRGATRLRHGERFSGLLSWWIDLPGLRAEFDRLNRALRTRAEHENSKR